MNKPMVMQVLEAMKTRFEQISSTRQPLSWYTSPTTIDIGHSRPSMAKPGPRLLLKCIAWSDQPTTSNLHQATMTVAVTCMIDESTDPEYDTHAIAADVLEAFGLADVDRLGLDNVIDVLPQSYTAETEYFEQAGKGSAVVIGRVRYRWTHTNP